MKDLIVNIRIIPDWGDCHAVALVYPYKMVGKAHLMPFYDKMLKYIPSDIKIILLVTDLSFSSDYQKKCLGKGILNKIEFVEFPDLYDIWVRDYAPITIAETGIHYPVKFQYAPAYIDKKYAKYIRYDHEAGHLLGMKYINKGERSVSFHWDMGNLTHNGEGTAIISNRLLGDNESVHIEHELKPLLLNLLGFSNVIFIPVDPEDETGRADGMARFIDENVLVVGAYPNYSRKHQFMNNIADNLKTDLGDDYTIIRLMNGEPKDIKSEGVSSAVGNHVNFLRINDLILFPYYNDQISQQPLLDFKSELEKNNLPITVIPVDIPEINEVARFGGVLNCISWQNFSESQPVLP